MEIIELISFLLFWIYAAAADSIMDTYGTVAFFVSGLAIMLLPDLARKVARR